MRPVLGRIVDPLIRKSVCTVLEHISFSTLPRARRHSLSNPGGRGDVADALVLDLEAARLGLNDMLVPVLVSGDGTQRPVSFGLAGSVGVCGSLADGYPDPRHLRG